MSDRFAFRADSVSSPARHAFPVAPADGEPLPFVTKALYVGTSGDVTLRTVDGVEDVTFRNVASGQVLDIRAEYVRATGTSAADLVALA